VLSLLGRGPSVLWSGSCHAFLFAVSQAFPGHELLGWYAATPRIDAAHLQIHAQLSDFSDSPLLLHLLPTVDAGAPTCVSTRISLPYKDCARSIAGAKELPLQLLVSNVSGGPLKQIPFKIESTESERLTIDHVTSKTSSSQNPRGCQVVVLACMACRLRLSLAAVGMAHLRCTHKSSPPDLSFFLSAVVQQLASTAAAVGVLSERLAVLQAYVLALKRGDVPPDDNLLRKVAAVAHKVPVTGSELILELNKASYTPPPPPPLPHLGSPLAHL
jgi:hypothetical protein